MRADRARRQAYADEAKSVPCADCDRRFPPEAIDFDHVRGSKLADISTLVRSGTMKLLRDEIDKCQVVCANCHRIRTAQRARAKSLLKVLDSRREAA